MKKRLLAFLLAAAMILGMLPTAAFAEEDGTPTLQVSSEAENPEEDSEENSDTSEGIEADMEFESETEEENAVLLEAPAEAKTETVSIVAQYSGAMLMAPQTNVEVSSDLAESYGYTDSVENGVSTMDVLVKAHEAMFGEDFTKDEASTYLVVSNNFITTMFGIADSNICFMINGRQPNDGNGTGYGISQAPVKTGDTVEFAFYQDTDAWSDNYVWLELQDGTKLDGQSVSAGATVNVVAKGYSPFSYGYLTEDKIQEHIAPVSGAKLALVDMETGELTDLDVTTDESGKASVTVPRDYANSQRVLTAYGDKMMMSLAKVSVGEATAATVLTGLEIAVGGGTLEEANVQTLTPAFSGDETSYSTPILNYVKDSTSRFAWVKATAPEGAELTARCGSSDVATLTSGEWTRLEVYKYWPDYKYVGTLETGTYNEVEIILSADGQDDVVYTVTVPMQPDTDNQSLTWKTNLKSAVYYITNAEGAFLSVEAQYQNRPLDNEDVITYQWYRNTAAGTEGSTAIEGATSATYAPGTAQTGVTYYYAVASCGKLEAVSNIIEVTVTDKEAPKSVTLTYEYPYTIPNDWSKALGGVSFVAAIGDTIQIHAVDENGDETPVSWSNQCYGGTLDEKTGVYTITSSSYSYLTAYSLYDSSISSGEKVIQISDYKISEYSRDQNVALSTDGQTKTKASLSAGVSGYNIWDIKMEPEGIAECTTDLTQKGGYVEFNLLRPGTITISYTVDVGGENAPALTDSTTRIVTGAAVEDAQGNQGKTYLELTGENKAPTAQLEAYLMTGRTVASWSSADEAVATVDENGLVTGHAIGSTIITVTDSEGTTGGIKVVVTDADKPTFENIAFSIGNMWRDGIKTQITFKPETTEYTGLELARYQSSSLDLTADTLYNAEKLTAVATYTDSNGKAAAVDVNSGAATKLPNIPFGTCTVTITLTDKQDANKKTDYTFEVTRPRDTTQQINNIAVKNAEGGALSADQYKEKAEGYLFRANSDGTIKNEYTVDYRELYYRAYLLDARPSFTMQTKGKSDYVHMRYSVDDGATWKELTQGGGSSDVITFPERIDGTNPVVKIVLQVVSDKTYVDGGNAFPETVTSSNGTTYTVWVEQLPSADAVKMLTATTDTGDWYPAFDPDVTSYKLSVANGSAAPVLTYTIAEGTTVSVGNENQTPNEAGEYSLTLTSSAQTVTVTSADGSIRRQYSFAYFERIANGADKVVDYLCVNSQYTNAGNYGMYPEYTLGSSSLKSLGNFGGYITYYFEDGLTDNPANQYGVDFYINGNAFKDTSTGTGLGSMEPGQVWVSEDGSDWYALAGSEHYDADTLWDYTVTYSKNGTGTSWSDNYGNSDNTVGRSFNWPLAENYPLNQMAKEDSFTLTGVLIPSVKGITGNDDFSTYSSGVRFGYVDALVNGTANPYAENDSYQNASSGFDLAWAVDAAGNPVNVSGMEFHYVKVVTASNIIAGAANEKSTEVANIARASAQEASVGVTEAPANITFSEDDAAYELPPVQGQQVYEVALAMQNVSITVNGSEGDNIYINNQRVASGTAATGFMVNSAGETLVRVIVQNGDKEPVIYLLKLTYAPEKLASQWASFRGNDQNNGITSSETPRDAKETELKWVQKISTGWSDTPSPMILVDDTVVTMAGSTLKKLRVTDGSTVASAAMDAATSWGSTPPFYADGYIFCQLNGGKVQAFNAKTLESLWVYTDENGGQAQSPIAYSDGKVYVGFGYGKEYAFVCLNANDGSVVWRKTDSQGYYWAGAVVAGDYVICGNENGIITSRNKLTGEVVSELSIGEKVRSSICYDGGRIFFTVYNAQLCWADLNTETGELTNLTKVDCSAYGANSTSTPVVYDGIAYIGVGGWSGNKSVVAVDTSSGSILWNIDEPAYPQCSVMLSTAYVDDGYVYLYVTYNDNPGGINVIKAKADGSEATQETLYTPDSDYQNYCICSVIADSNGTLYYKNDSGCIFALSKIQSQKDEAVEQVIALINAIGTPVTLESESAITAARTGYDALTDAQKAQITNYAVLTAAEDALAALKQPVDPETIQVSFEVLGDSAHGEDGDVHTLSGNNLEVWLSENTYTIDKDATVWDLVKLVLDENEITYSNPTGNYLVSLTKDGVTLGEFTNGSKSGWMYTLNGNHPNQGIGQQTLADGDAVVLHYTDDYTQERSRIQVNVTVSNAGEIVMAMESVSVADRNEDGKFNVDEVLYAAHEAGYTGGAAAGYAAEVGSYGLSITKLWGDESGAFGYWLNHASCMGLTDEVHAGDYVSAFIYKDQTGWSDAYTKFDKQTYTAAGELTVTLEKAGYDADWNTVFSKLSGAAITAYDTEGNALNASAYTVKDNGDGTYTITFAQNGTYTLIAAENTIPIVPAVSKVSVTIAGKETDPEKIYKETGKRLEGQEASKFVYGSEWIALGLARSDLKVPDSYYKSVVEYVKENINDSEQLSRSKSTENSRLILALTALGYDVTDVGGHNLLTGLNSMSYLKKQGINGPIWALLAFDSHDYTIPEGDVTREKLIETILTAQLSDGGWAFSGEKSDSDMTGMALQALAPYYKKDAKVKAAVDKALEKLSNMQLADGSFYTYNTDGSTYSNAESTAQVIVALTALGINPETDARFVKNGYSVLDALCGFAVEGGGFKHVMDGDWNGMATEQGYYALASYFRMVDSKTRLYDMSDVTFRTNDPADPADPADPTEPADPTDPGKPADPTDPTDPGKPAVPDAVLKEDSKVEVPGVNEIINITPDIKNNDLGVILSGDLAEAFKLTDEEKAAGVWVWVELEVLTDAEVSEEDAAAIKAGLKDNTLGSYLSIQLFKQTPNGEKVAVTETGTPVTITLVVPENLRAAKRTFSIVYSHNGGKAKVITPESYDAETGKLVFQASQFSIYALAYKDAKTGTSTVTTGDDSNMLFYTMTLCVSALGLAAVFAANKKKKAGR